MVTAFPKLLAPGKIGKMELKNRVVSAPMGTSNSNSEGFVTQTVIDYYTEEAKGGLGLIVAEGIYIDTILSKAQPNQIGLWSTEHVAGWGRLVTAIHDQGCKIVPQLCHIGNQLQLAGERESLGPSEMIEMKGGIMPSPIRGITREEMAQVIEDFGDAAYRAKIAGCDGVQIHGAIGHLISMFCTPFYNRREDEYGGSPENRIRFFVEIVENVRKKCGKDFPIIARVTGCDYDPDGLTLEEGVLHCQILEKAGVAGLHVVGGSDRNMLVLDLQYEPRGIFVPIAEAMKEAGIKIPIILDGGFTKPEFGEKVLQEGKADFIGLGRPTLADTEWTNKVIEGRPEDIVPCLRCMNGCTGTMEHLNLAYSIRCSVNPRHNLSSIRQINPLKRKKKVCVIGGGPGGMEAARLAAVRGHEVTLYERRKLGGTMHEAAFDLSFKDDITFLIDYYLTQMKKLDINVVYEEATAETVLNGGFDSVIQATGAPAITSRVPGTDAKHVVSVLDYTGDREMVEKLGDTVLVIGGCFFNVEIAYSLAKKGKKVILSTRRGEDNGLFEIADDFSVPTQQRLIGLTTAQYPVDYRLMSDLIEITDDGAILKDTLLGDEAEVKCDNIILCRGYHGDSKLYRSLFGTIEINKVGDCQVKSRCNESRNIGDAIHEGWVVANRI